MLNVALTGNVASGKSTVLRHFADWGATVIDADQLVREAQQPGSPALEAIVDRFGREALRADGSLDRDALRRRVMADAEARAALEAIMHPVVRQRRDALAAQARARGEALLVNDIPLLFEALSPSAFDLVVLVDAPDAVRRRRLIRHRGLTGAEADRLMASQLPAAAKRDRSDLIIENDGSLAELETRTQKVWETLVRLARERG